MPNKVIEGLKSLFLHCLHEAVPFLAPSSLLCADTCTEDPGQSLLFITQCLKINKGYRQSLCLSPACIALPRARPEKNLLFPEDLCDWALGVIPCAMSPFRRSTNFCTSELVVQP